MNNRPARLRVSFNSPAVLCFAFLCLLAQILNIATAGAANRVLFSVYRSSPLNPLIWLRCALHVLGHASWSHLTGNMMTLLILGPMLEEKYGTRDLALVMLATAVVTGLVNMIFFPSVRLLGASGIVFAMILLSSITCTEDGSVPLSFLLVAALYIGQQVFDGLFTRDSVSQITHIAGGAVGTILGFAMNRGRKRAA